MDAIRENHINFANTNYHLTVGRSVGGKLMHPATQCAWAYKHIKIATNQIELRYANGYVAIYKSISINIDITCNVLLEKWLLSPPPLSPLIKSS